MVKFSQWKRCQTADSGVHLFLLVFALATPLAVEAQFAGNVVQEASHSPVAYPFMRLTSSSSLGGNTVANSDGAFLSWFGSTLYRFTNTTSAACSVTMTTANTGFTSTSFTVNYAFFESDTSVIAVVYLDNSSIRSLFLRVLFDPVANTLTPSLSPAAPLMIPYFFVAFVPDLLRGYLFALPQNVGIQLFVIRLFDLQLQLQRSWLPTPVISALGIEGFACDIGHNRFFVSVFNYTTPIAYTSLMGMDVSNVTNPSIFLAIVPPPAPFLDFEPPCVFDATRNLIYFPLYRDGTDVIHPMGSFALLNNANTLRLTGLLDLNLPGMLSSVPTFNRGYPNSLHLDSTLQLMFLFNEDTVYVIDLVSFMPLFTHGVKTSVKQYGFNGFGLSGTIDTTQSVLYYLGSDARNASLPGNTAGLSIVSYANVFCPPGVQPPNTNATHRSACLACPTGMGVFKQPWGRHCQACDVGQFARVGVCFQCEKGSFQQTQQSTSCELCSAGRFSDVKGSSECASCAAGRFAASNQSTCGQCSPGRFSPAGSPLCIKCDPGQMASQSGSTACVPCQPGNYSLNGQAFCTPCERGSYSASAGVSACEACPVSLSTPSIGASSSKDCSVCEFAGTLLLNNTQSCVCAAGYQLGPQNQCVQCSPSQFKATPSNSPCFDCPINTASTPNRLSCVCVPGFYQSPSLRLCGLCPTGLSSDACSQLHKPNAGGDCSAGNLTTARGYWRANSQSETLYPCAGDGCAGGDACEAGYASTLCTECLADYAYIRPGVCAYCPQSNAGELFVLLVVAVAFVLFIFSQAGSAKTAIVTIFLNYLQLLGLVHLSQQFQGVSSAFRVFQLDFFSTKSNSCILAADFETQWFLSLLAPVFLLLLLLASFVCIALPREWLKHRRNTPSTPTSDAASSAFSGKPLFARLLVASIGVLLFTYISVTKAALSMWSCESVSVAEVLVTYPSMECWQGNHVTLAVIAAVFFAAFSVGVVLLVAALLWRSRPASGQDAASKPILCCGLSIDFGFFRAPYQSQPAAAQYWELVIFLRRMAVLLPVALLADYPTLQGFIVAALLDAFRSAHTRVNPYKQALDNRMEATALAVLELSFALSALAASGVAGVNQTAVQVVILVSNAILIAFFVVVVAPVAARKLKGFCASPSASADIDKLQKQSDSAGVQLTLQPSDAKAEDPSVSPVASSNSKESAAAATQEQQAVALTIAAASPTSLDIAAALADAPNRTLADSDRSE